MLAFIQVLTSGIAIGCVYGLVALSFVLIYKATETVSFMQGDLLMLGAFAALALHLGLGWPLWLAAPVAVAAAGALGAALERLALRRAIGQPHLVAVLLTFGLGMMMRGGVASVPAAAQDTYRLPFAADTVAFGPLVLASSHLWVVGATFLLAGALAAFFHHTRTGRVLRACSEDARTAALLGWPVARMHTLAWALGAYTQAVLVRHGVPALLAVPAAVLAGALGGVLASLPARRLGGLYFGMSTLAFALIVEEGLARWESVTHGAAGMAVAAFGIFGWQATTTAAQALVSLAALLLALLACRRLLDLHHGRAWRAVRDDEAAAAACGISPAATKMQAFLVGGALSGLAGALYAHWIGFISPEQFGLVFSFELLMLAFIGGARRLAGAVWGALVIVAIPPTIALLRDLLPGEWARTAGLETVAFGAVIVAVVLLRPAGLAGKD